MLQKNKVKQIFTCRLYTGKLASVIMKIIAIIWDFNRKLTETQVINPCFT